MREKEEGETLKISALSSSVPAFYYFYCFFVFDKFTGLVDSKTITQLNQSIKSLIFNNKEIKFLSLRTKNLHFLLTKLVLLSPRKLNLLMEPHIACILLDFEYFYLTKKAFLKL